MRARLGEAPFAGVLVALAIGDQDAIPPAQWDVFWRTAWGTS
jgi:competence protein ComEC